MSPTIGFIGAGRLAAALAAAFQSANFPVTTIASRSIASAEALASVLGPGVNALGSEQGVADACDVVILAVPDRAIASVAGAVAWSPRHHVVHCSGALGLDVLAHATNARATVGCLHPLQTFPSRVPQPGRFAGVYCGIEGPPSLAIDLEEAALRLGSHTFRLEGVDRTAYHAAAVFMSNFAVALATAATRSWEIAGIDIRLARPALSPLLLAAAQNIATMELDAALTGPLARGDVDTIEAHLRTLNSEPELNALYRQLSAQLLQLPLGHDPERRSAIQNLVLRQSENHLSG